ARSLTRAGPPASVLTSFRRVRLARAWKTSSSRSSADARAISQCLNQMVDKVSAVKLGLVNQSIDDYPPRGAVSNGGNDEYPSGRDDRCKPDGSLRPAYLFRRFHEDDRRPRGEDLQGAGRRLDDVRRGHKRGQRRDGTRQAPGAGLAVAGLAGRRLFDRAVRAGAGREGHETRLRPGRPPGQRPRDARRRLEQDVLGADERAAPGDMSARQGRAPPMHELTWRRWASLSSSDGSGRNNR